MRGFEPVFHAHTSTYVEAPAEIDRLLELSTIDLLVDTGHLLARRLRPDPGAARLGAARRLRAPQGRAARRRARRSSPRASAGSRRGGAASSASSARATSTSTRFLDALRATGYDGWLCVEQDRIPRDDEPLSEAAEAQVRNREWLRQRGL